MDKGTTTASSLLAEEGRLCGVWVDDEGQVRAAVAPSGGGKRAERAFPLKPFAWLGEGATEVAAPTGVEIQILAGEGVFRHLAHAEDVETFEALMRRTREAGAVDVIRPLESQFLLQRRLRLYRDLAFADLRRCQIDVAYDGEGPVLEIRLRQGGRTERLALAEPTDAAEKELLTQFQATLAELDPDVIEGHGIFMGPLDHLRERSRLRKVPPVWGRFGQKASFRNSRLKAAERWIDFTRCDLPGRTVVDYQLLVQLYDVSARDMAGYSRGAAAEYFGVANADSLLEIHALGDRLLPTYFEQARTFPLLLQDATLRGQTSKIDLLFQEEYYHARQACPVPPEILPFEGGFTKSYHEGVFRDVMHFDFASLYPSLMLSMGRNPKSDSLGVFIPLLKSLREYRLLYKQKAKSAPTAHERAEAQARQTAFKILINSFYGYLGFSGARFGDGDLAAEVTRRGRELLLKLIDEFGRHDCVVLEADTDGIYLSSPKHAAEPEVLLDLVDHVLPPGIDLEYDGSYAAMVCYKAKNYALYDGEKLTLRGSAFRSRAMEPFLQRLTDRLLGFLVGSTTEAPQGLWDEYRKKIAARELPVNELAKTEALSQSPDAYERFVAEGGKPRRAAAEAALQLDPRPRMGERVSYYIGPKSKGQTSDWQRARPAAKYDAATAPYDPAYYLDKLDDWKTRYGMFLPQPAGADLVEETQGELL